MHFLSADTTAEEPTGQSDTKTEKPLGETGTTAEKPLGETGTTAEKPLGETGTTTEKPLGEINITTEKNPRYNTKLPVIGNASANQISIMLLLACLVSYAAAEY